MTSEWWQRVEEVFENARARPTQERASVLDENCGDDSAMRKEVEALLAADDHPSAAFDRVVSKVAADWANDGTPSLVGRQIGRYQILEPLGSGGMGEVYLALDPTLERNVALKLLPTQFTQDRDRIRRFEQEARAASALNHPNIITIYEIGEWEGTRFIATEYVEGKTLHAPPGHSPRPLADVLEIGIQAAGALAAAHEAGIVHRDIKPANIMLRRDRYVKVLDFGLAKLTNARAHLDVTEPGRVMGTITYMSPEQAMGQPLDHRTDIFSLGVVLYELATSHRLFEGQSEAAVYDSILHHAPPPIREFNPASPAELDDVIRRALEKDPALRYQTATELQADLRRLAQGTEPVRAPFVGPRRAQRWLVPAASTVLVLAASAGLWFWKFQNKPLTAGEKSIAILPFENTGQDPDNAYFAAGLQEEILARLSKVAELKTISRASTLRYQTAPTSLPEIARQLGVAYVLEGSVQKSGEQLQLSVRLMDARRNAVVWTEKMERAVAESFAVESEIATRIARTLQAQPTNVELQEIASRPTENSTAHQLYLRGRYLMAKRTEQNLQRAIDYFYQALAQDPKYAPAYADIAFAYALLPEWSNEPAENSLAQAKTAADQALALDESLPEAHIAMGMIAQKEFDIPRVTREFQRAVELDPHSSTAHYGLGMLAHTPVGEFDQALVEFKRALELDPFSMILRVNLGYCYLLARRYDEAIATLQAAAELDPNFPYLSLMLSHAYELKGDLPEAFAACEKASVTSHDARALLVQAHLRAKQGERERALQLLGEAKASHQLGREWAFGYALVYLALDDKAQAVDWLDRGYRTKERAPYFMQVDPMLDALRDDPRFEALRRKIFGGDKLR